MRPLSPLRRRLSPALLLGLGLTGASLPATAETPPASWTPTVHVPPPEPPPRPDDLKPPPAGAQPAPLPPERPPELSAPRTEPSGQDRAKAPDGAKATEPAPAEAGTAAPNAAAGQGPAPTHPLSAAPLPPERPQELGVAQPAPSPPAEAAAPPAATHPLPAAPLPPARPPELDAPQTAPAAPAAPLAPSRDVPLPPERPSELTAKPVTEPSAPAPAAPLPPARPPELSPNAPAPGQPVPMPDDTACRHRLERLGVRFAPQEPIVNGQCSVAAPLTVSALGDGVALSSAETMTCPIAEALARWTTEVQAAAEKELGDTLKGLRLGGGYACRGMNHGPDAQLSEHAFANAVDVMGFTFGKHAPVAVGFLPAGTPEAAFLTSVRAKACGFFRTVLGPGANEAHANHLHFDERDRTRGLRLCE